MLQALHAAVLICAVASHPWSTWALVPANESGPGDLAQMGLGAIRSGSIVVAVVHVFLCARGPRPAVMSGFRIPQDGAT